MAVAAIVSKVREALMEVPEWWSDLSSWADLLTYAWPPVARHATSKDRSARRRHDLQMCERLGIPFSAMTRLRNGHRIPDVAWAKRHAPSLEAEFAVPAWKWIELAQPVKQRTYLLARCGTPGAWLRHHRSNQLCEICEHAHYEALVLANPCGTLAAYFRHRRNGEKRCAACQVAGDAYWERTKRITTEPIPDYSVLAPRSDEKRGREAPAARGQQIDA
jgi:hypothetical protein